MLLGNYSTLNRNTNTMPGNAFTNPMALFKATALHRFYQGEHVVTGETDRSAFPNGARPPASWWLAPAAGGLASYGLTVGLGTASANVAGGLNAAALVSCTSTADATGQLVVSGAGTAAGSCTVTGGLQAVLQAVATGAGSSTCAGTMTAIGHAQASAAGASTVTAVPRATGLLAGTITSNTELSPQSLASAVWSSPEGAFIYALQHSKVITDPIAGTMTVYASDGTTPLYTAALKKDASGSLPYSGTGAERRERFE